MGMGFAPTWLRQVSPLLHKTTLTTAPTEWVSWNWVSARGQKRPEWWGYRHVTASQTDIFRQQGRAMHICIAQ